VVFAFHAALYRLPLAQSLLAYGRLEYGRAANAFSKGCGGREREDEATLLDLLLPEVSLALGANSVHIGADGSAPAFGVV
jgi:hypothetical protein